MIRLERDSVKFELSVEDAYELLGYTQPEEIPQATWRAFREKLEKAIHEQQVVAPEGTRTS